MQPMPDWNALWTELVRIGEKRRAIKHQHKKEDRWHQQAEKFDARVTERWQNKDSSRAFVVETLQQFPNSRVLDIGAGSGKWTTLMAPYAAHVTALDASDSMLEKCAALVKQNGLDNVTCIKGYWPQVDVGEQDISICAHSMYSCEDLKGFIAAMQKVTRKRCILLLRAPLMDGIMAEAARLLWGHPYDSANFQIAFQIILEMGIFPNVIMEEGGQWKGWCSGSLQGALQEMKTRMGVYDDSQWDDAFLGLIHKYLKQEGDEWVWPPAMRTALVYWDIRQENQ